MLANSFHRSVTRINREVTKGAVFRHREFSDRTLWNRFSNFERMSSSEAKQDIEKLSSQILNKIHQIIQEQSLISDKYDKSNKVVEFIHPKDLEKVLPLRIGGEGTSFSELEKITEDVVKYSVKTCHPYFFNQLYHGADEYGLAGTWLSEALNTNNHTYEVAPVFILVEQAIIKYLMELLSWDTELGDGIFSPGGSLSNMYGMVLARQAKHPEFKTKGLFGAQPLVAFTSEESHYSIKKGANWLGIGMENVIPIVTDQGGNMIPEELEKAIIKAKQENKDPFFVNATSGSTVTGAYDDLERLSEICRRHEVWLHVDACWGGAALLSNKRKHLMKGCELVDSLAFNPHKMLGAPLQTSPFLTRHKDLLFQANSSNATYLFQQDKFYDVSYDTGDKSIQCGRKVDAFKLWFMMKARGEKYFESLVDHTFDMADLLQLKVNQRKNFRLVPAFNNRKCTNVGFWFIPDHMLGQEETAEWWDKIGSIAPKIKESMILDGTLMIGYQPLPYKNYRNFFRMVIHCVPKAEPEYMDYLLDTIQKYGEKLAL